MKIESYKADKLAAFLKAPHKQSRGVLVYGPDNGLVRERSKTVMEAVIGKNADPLNQVELSGDQIKNDPALLLDELCAMSLMGGSRIVIISNPNEKLEPVLKSAFETVKDTTYLMVEADDLGTSSALRKLFENSDILAAIACYLPDSADLQHFIKTYTASLGLGIRQDAVAYLSDNLGNDRGVTRSELDKIALYLGEEKEITLATAMKLVGNDSSDTTEDLCHAIALGKAAEADKLLIRLYNEGTQPIAILRSLLNYFRRLEIAMAHVAAGQSRDNAIKMLRPPVFFKSQDIMKSAMARLNQNKITALLNRVLQAEKEAKSGIISAEMVTQDLIVSLQRI